MRLKAFILGTITALVLATAAFGQNATATTTPTTAATTIFSAQSGPLAIQYNGQWSVGSFVAERYDLLDFGATKANHVSVDGIQLLAPTPGVNMYMGGFDYEPNLTALTKKLNMPQGSFALFVNGAVGTGTVSSGQNGIAWAAGGGAAYKLTGDLTWQPLLVDYGKFGSNQFLAMSTQLSFIFHK